MGLAIVVVWLAIGLIPFASHSALAQQAEVPAACRTDIPKLCPGIKPGAGKILECLKGKEPELSEKCKAVLAAASTIAPERDFKACQGDVGLYCKDIEPGEGRIRECLHKNASQLTAACKQFQKRIKE